MCLRDRELVGRPVQGRYRRPTCGKRRDCGGGGRGIVSGEMRARDNFALGLGTTQSRILAPANQDDGWCRISCFQQFRRAWKILHIPTNTEVKAKNLHSAASLPISSPPGHQSTSKYICMYVPGYPPTTLTPRNRVLPVHVLAHTARPLWLSSFDISPDLGLGAAGMDYQTGDFHTRGL